MCTRLDAQDWFDFKLQRLKAVSDQNRREEPNAPCQLNTLLYKANFNKDVGRRRGGGGLPRIFLPRQAYRLSLELAPGGDLKTNWKDV